jgi:hypothetical protein
VIARLNDALAAALEEDRVRRRLIDVGCEIPKPDERSPGALGALMRADIARWTPLLRIASPMN